MLNDAIETHVHQKKGCREVIIEVYRVIFMINQPNIVTGLLIRDRHNVDENQNAVKCFPEDVEFGAVAYPALLNLVRLLLILQQQSFGLSCSYE